MMLNEIYNAELNIFLEAIKSRYGYDFTEYARGSLKRRVRDLKAVMGVETIADLVPYVFHNEEFLPLMLEHLSVQFSEMFRDPHFYKTLRQEAIPILKTYPQINIWIAGCANGEEAYSLAILLKEEGLLDRANIYATDISVNALEKAKEGVYPIEEIDVYDANYLKAGGKTQLSDYYVSRYDFMALDPSLKESIFFSEHNLAVDGVFCEMHLVLCRNVLIYFNRKLQNRCLDLFDEALIREGFLGLGEKESINLSKQRKNYCRLSDETPFFRKKVE
ncbi:CheR family methyltransferase [Curvivirga aplysinae]|uniref:CheR family methyltransferase n=1 Tax=Curvivirga aplysinae TaxID=2529852 RepID=UPI0012BD776B|nr:CheR family methyltransferase [Curvivirga aplysinae]MTI10620.1 protein-glutamate O-methyltransferase CheR [Curvivirga aplysinae]